MRTNPIHPLFAPPREFVLVTRAQLKMLHSEKEALIEVRTMLSTPSSGNRNVAMYARQDSKKEALKRTERRQAAVYQFWLPLGRTPERVMETKSEHLTKFDGGCRLDELVERCNAAEVTRVEVAGVAARLSRQIHTFGAVSQLKRLSVPRIVRLTTPLHTFRRCSRRNTETIFYSK